MKQYPVYVANTKQGFNITVGESLASLFNGMALEVVGGITDGVPSITIRKATGELPRPSRLSGHINDADLGPGARRIWIKDVKGAEFPKFGKTGFRAALNPEDTSIRIPLTGKMKPLIIKSRRKLEDTPTVPLEAQKELLKTSLSALNDLKRDMGDTLSLSIDESGFLKATIRIEETFS